MRKQTIFALHTAACAHPEWILTHLGADGSTTEVTSVDFHLAVLPTDRKCRRRFQAVRNLVHDIAADSTLRSPAARGWRVTRFNGHLTKAVRQQKLRVHRALMMLGEDRCTPKSMETMLARFVRQLEAEEAEAHS